MINKFSSLLLVIEFLSNYGYAASNTNDFEHNTLPDLPFDISPKYKGKLVKVTRESYSYLCGLKGDLVRCHQDAPNLTVGRKIRLLKGNEDAGNDRGWIIKVMQGQKEIEAGFICYYQTSVYSEEDWQVIESFSCLKGKVCAEIEFYVAPKYQWKGIAYAAFETVLSYVKRQEKGYKIDFLTASTSENNSSAQGFLDNSRFQLLAVGPYMDSPYIWALPIVYSSLETLETPALHEKTLC